jgi:hypothetical protein
LNAFNQFARLSSTKRIPSVLLLSEKQEKLADSAVLGEKRIVAKMPLKMKEFRSLLRKLLA